MPEEINRIIERIAVNIPEPAVSTISNGTTTSQEVRDAFTRIESLPTVNNEDPFEEKAAIKVREYKPNDDVPLYTGKSAKFKDVVKVGNYYALKTDNNVLKDDYVDGDYIFKDDRIVFLKSIKGDKAITGNTHFINAEYCPRLTSKKFGINNIAVINIELLDPKLFTENVYRGHFFDTDEKFPVSETNIKNITKYETYRNFTEGLNSLTQSFKLGKRSPSFTISEGIQYTFGVELEVYRGYLPAWKAKTDQLNITCVRDGSINSGDGGAEYVTGVMTGDTGFKHLQEICLELSKRTRVDYTCGVHVHLGGFDFTNQFLVNSYILCLLLEKQIFEFLPESRRNNRYCRRLKDLKLKVALDNSKDNLELQESYNNLFRYISVNGVAPGKDYNKSRQHPLGAKCHYDQSTPRYCWINYVPAVFNTRNNIKGYSLELRNHSGTTNFTKIKNWILLFMAICSFTERYPNRIVKGITVEEILTAIYPKKHKSLIFYFNNRKELFKTSSYESEDKEESRKTIKQLIKD